MQTAGERWRDPGTSLAMQEVVFGPLCPPDPGGFGMARTRDATQQLLFALETTWATGTLCLVLQGVKMPHSLVGLWVLS